MMREKQMNFRECIVADPNGRVQHGKASPVGEQSAGRRRGQRHEQSLRAHPRGNDAHLGEPQLRQPGEEQREQQLRDARVQQEIVAVERRQPGHGYNSRWSKQAHLTMEVVAKHVEPSPLQEQSVRRDHRV